MIIAFAVFISSVYLIEIAFRIWWLGEVITNIKLFVFVDLCDSLKTIAQRINTKKKSAAFWNYILVIRREESLGSFPLRCIFASRVIFDFVRGNYRLQSRRCHFKSSSSPKMCIYVIVWKRFFSSLELSITAKTWTSMITWDVAQ